MNRSQILETLYQRLKNPELEKSAFETTWATGNGIYKELFELFDDSVHIIHPVLSSISSPADSKDIAGAVNYAIEIENIIKNDGGFLARPIIAVWSTKSAGERYENEEQKETQDLTGGLHWQICAILPKFYITLRGV